MSRDRPTRRDEQDDDEFSDALDDLFGSSAKDNAPGHDPSAERSSMTDPDSSITEPSTTAEAPIDVQYYPQTGMPGPPATAQQGRTFTRTLGIGCASLLTLIFVCFIVFAIIGWLSGDTSAS